MRRVRRSVPEVRLDLTPLIDVVFLLLTFFLFSMVLMVRADVLDVKLPEIGSGRPGERASAITVSIDKDGSVFVNGDPFTVDEVAAEVQRLRAESAEAPVLIAVDEGGRAGRLIELADVLRGAGITEFSVIGRPSPARELSLPKPASGGA
ncbi:MAG: biopolymer transporter ExbD [Phycisphaerales bacterium]